MPGHIPQTMVNDEILLTFSDRDYDVYNAVLTHGLGLQDMRLVDLAKAAHVSNAAVVRFCKKCGFEGFPQFKQSFLKALESGFVAMDLPPVSNDADAFFNRQDVDVFHDAIGRASRALIPAKGTLFVGLGCSGGLANYGSSLFSAIGRFSISITSFPAQQITTHPMPGSVGVVISRSGATSQVVEATQELRRSNYPLVAITSDAASPIARLSDVCICYSVPERQVTSHSSVSTSLPIVYALEELTRRVYNARS